MSSVGLITPNFAKNKSSFQQTIIPPKIASPTLTLPKIGTPRLIISDNHNLIPPNIMTPKLKISEPISDIEENPWIPPKPEGNTDVKIISSTPIGTIPLVPTCDMRPPTPKRLVNKYPKNSQKVVLNIINEPKIDPLLTTAIYLDCTKQEDRDYNHVSNKMKSITNVISLHRKYLTQLKPIPNISGKVSHKDFEEALSIYENNQVYYQDRLDDKSIDVKTISQRLTELEYWFICIIEPKPLIQEDVQQWRDRELFKIKNGLTSYCDPEVHKYITKAGPDHIKFIQYHHMGLI